MHYSCGLHRVIIQCLAGLQSHVTDSFDVRPYNHLLTQKFYLALMSPNLNHLFHFVDFVKICNIKVVATETVEL